MTKAEAEQLIVFYASDLGIKTINGFDFTFYEIPWVEIRDDWCLGDNKQIYVLDSGEHYFLAKQKFISHARKLARAINTVCDSNNWINRLKRFESIIKKFDQRFQDRLHGESVWF